MTPAEVMSHPRARPCMVTPVAATARPQDDEAPLAQSAERLHGKEKVYGSIP